MEKSVNIPCAMTVAGSDSGAGAGIQADMLAMAANGVYACTTIAALTAQNPDGVSGIETPKAEMLVAQMKAVAEFYKPSAAKTGMLFSAEIVEAVADFFAQRKNIALVVDPVIVSTSGSKLLKDDAVEVMKTRLIPLSAVFTPNLDEAAVLLGGKMRNSMADNAKALRDIYRAPVLLKGGHMEGDKLEDVLATPDGQCRTIHSRRIKNVNTHGSGCTLSAAIAANLAKGMQLFDACKAAHAYLLAGMQNSLRVGGQNFINHFPKIKKQ